MVLVEAMMVKVTLEMHQQATAAHMRQSMLITAAEMSRPMLFSQAIVIVAFMPIFTFQRVEAKNFLSDGLHAHFRVAGFPDHQPNPDAGAVELFAGTAARRVA